MKKLFNLKRLANALSVGLMAVSGLAWSQTAPSPDTSEKAKPAASAKKAVTKKVQAKKEPVKPARAALKLDAINLAVAAEAADAALTPDELDIASRVYIGKLPCELGANVTLSADEKNPGYFHVVGKNFKYYMFPVATTTGAIRLEDRKAGAVWLQLANKSMLMNNKLGTRLADECASPAQVAVADALKLNPVSVFDAPKPALPAASSAQAEAEAAPAK
ncbi:hypothetical protein HC248_00961 [Polaromonas vacuolata]|uniref:Uncharacterized protein n=1 Tax=Polaromonas vacuolata TaxID=37448 RepID=A0A6H2H737_9BURK|nr:hypothetical protein [Polaromonas vacuolata]QJC55679.1 hypothetical protein HC248_00961 [Polaromonas vacuolata]